MWTVCDRGERHWGRYGAAGLLLVTEGAVLLQHRAAWVHMGGTWSIPGGALNRRWESPRMAAMRETREETGLDTAAVRVTSVHVDDHGAWSYTTLIGRAGERLAVASGDEGAAAWVPLEDVAGLRLHAGFAAAWPILWPLCR
jgi:ADP-ribose pyrophosphatase YjhB (NUDIX family)